MQAMLNPVVCAAFHYRWRAVPRGNCCSIAFCSCVGLAAWRGDILQQSDATWYQSQPNRVRDASTPAEQHASAAGEERIETLAYGSGNTRSWRQVEPWLCTRRICTSKKQEGGDVILMRAIVLS